MAIPTNIGTRRLPATLVAVRKHPGSLARLGVGASLMVRPRCMVRSQGNSSTR